MKMRTNKMIRKKRVASGLFLGFLINYLYSLIFDLNWFLMPKFMYLILMLILIIASFSNVVKNKKVYIVNLSTMLIILMLSLVSWPTSISNESELIKMCDSNYYSNYVLTQDIVVENNSSQYICYENSFKGTLNGRGHIITFNKYTEGLFHEVVGEGLYKVKISNLIFENSNNTVFGTKVDNAKLKNITLNSVKVHNIFPVMDIGIWALLAVEIDNSEIYNLEVNGLEVHERAFSLLAFTIENSSIKQVIFNEIEIDSSDFRELAENVINSTIESVVMRGTIVDFAVDGQYSNTQINSRFENIEYDLD
jgi:hypothetical protein